MSDTPFGRYMQQCYETVQAQNAKTHGEPLSPPRSLFNKALRAKVMPTVETRKVRANTPGPKPHAVITPADWRTGLNDLLDSIRAQLSTPNGPDDPRLAQTVNQFLVAYQEALATVGASLQQAPAAPPPPSATPADQAATAEKARKALGEIRSRGDNARRKIASLKKSTEETAEARSWPEDLAEAATRKQREGKITAPHWRF